MKLSQLLVLFALALAGCLPVRPTAAAPEAEPPSLAREFRGVWVASVSNIDWPSKPGLPAEQQKAELIRILDRAAELRLNAVILQVRPGADALYGSPLEPWSEYLTGEMGKAPEPYYDPLAFAVTEAHRRGLELHAWFNPYRARHPSARSAISEQHLSRTRPEIVHEYGRHLWMDPGERAVQDHTTAVVLDVVRRYDVDGVHIDDYFYPYKERDAQGRLIEFPDERSWSGYRAEGGALERDDWRRANVDQLIERLYREIKAEKPWVKFGISPFGIWRPGHPRQVQGFDAYTELYADARKWLVEGWVDYFTPQLYWPIEQTAQSFPVLLNWWVEQNQHQRHIWPGSFTNRVGSDTTGVWTTGELLGQIYVSRGHPGSSGHVHFSMRSLMQSPDSLVERLLSHAYAEPALVPASPWLGAGQPGRPEASVERSGSSGVLHLAPAREGEVWLWAVRTRSGSAWKREVVPGWKRTHPLPAPTDEVVVTAVSRVGVESPAAQVWVGDS